MKVEPASIVNQETMATSTPSQDLHFRDLLAILSRKRRLILSVTLASAILPAIVVLLMPDQFTAETVVLPPEQNSPSSALLSQLGGAGGGALASAAGVGLGIKNPGEMYVSLFESRTVEEAVVKRFGLVARYHAKRVSQARRAFEGHAKVLLGAKDGLITITVKDPDPVEAANLANGYVDEFRKLSANLAITEASQRRLLFQQQLLEADQNLTNAEEAMRDTMKSTGILDATSQARTLIEAAAMLRAQLVSAEVELQAMSAYATKDNPDYVLAQQQVDGLRAQLAKLSGTLKDSKSEIIVPRGNIPEAGMEYLRRLRDVKYYETLAELIAKQYEMAKLDEAREGAVIQVADVAVPPDNHSSPKRTITVIVTTLLGFFGSCAWCVFGRKREALQSQTPE
jgi:uncharacterized protein involved in exopolysaccharide biosynthesis